MITRSELRESLKKYLATREEMKRQGCGFYMGRETYCRILGHGLWDDDRNECSTVGSAVRAGWNAAISEAIKRMDSLIRHAEGLDARETASTLIHSHLLGGLRVEARELRALLSNEGGDDERSRL